MCLAHTWFLFPQADPGTSLLALDMPLAIVHMYLSPVTPLPVFAGRASGAMSGRFPATFLLHPLASPSLSRAVPSAWNGATQSVGPGPA